MHILLLRQHFAPPSAAGSGRPYEMATRWIKAGHRVTLITSTAKFPAETELNQKVNHFDIDGIQVVAVDVKYHNSYGFLRRIWSFMSFAKQCVNAAKQVKDVDVVLASSTPLTVALPAVKIAKRFGCPMVFEVRDLWPEMPIAVGALRSPLLKYVARKLEQYAYRNSDRIIALSPGMASGIVALGYPERRITVVPNSSDVERFRHESVSAAHFLQRFPMLEGRPFVLYAGTLGKLNGVEYLAEIAHEMKSINPKVAFVVLGDGARGEIVRRVARRCEVLDDNFFMLGSLPKQDIPDAFAAATICCSLFVNIPEMNKNSANKFFDALAAAKPIMINYQGWQARLIEGNDIGIHVPAKDPIESARRISRLLDEPARLVQLSQGAGKMGVERFSVDELSARALDVLEMSIKVQREKTA